MAFTETIPFTTASNYTISDSSKAEVNGGYFQLKLSDLPNQDFNEPFDSDTGFTYDNTKSEFSGGQVQQKSQRITNAVFGATYTSSINGSWGDGTLTGTASNGATITSNRLDLSGGVSGRKVSYNVDNLPDMYQTGAFKFKFTPNYSGAPSSQQTIINISSGGLSNWISVYHYTNGYIRLIIYDNAGVNLGEALYYWITNVAATTYEIEAGYDITAGNLYFFIDGTRVAIKTGATGTRSGTLTQFYLGEWYNGVETPDFYLEDLVLFDSVQHTANYTPGYTLEETDYLVTTVTLPEMEYTGAGTLQLLSAFVTTDTNTPKYTIQVGRSGNYLYWDGAAWSVSDGTYAQANDATTFNTNAASLDIESQIYGQFKINFNATNLQMSVADLTATVTGQTYATDNPTCQPTITWYLEALERFEETATVSGNDVFKYILKKGTSWYYWDGSAWSVSDETYTQSNTAAEIETNKATFTTNRILFGIKIFAHSNNGTTNPKLDKLEIDYDYAGDTPDTVNECIIWGYQKDGTGNADTTEVTAILNRANVKYKTNTNITNATQSDTPDSTSYWEMSLVDTVNMETGAYYIVTLNGKKYKLDSVPADEAKKSFWACNPTEL